MSEDKTNLNIDNSDQEWKPRISPWIIAISVMLATFMEVLDTSVANVSLPQMAGSFSATTNEATWVLTSYLIANAIILPSAAWFGSYFGRKKFFIVCIAIFTLSSLMCGISSSLGMLVMARIFQGLGGGALQPISQAILLESFPRSQRGLAMAVFGMGVVVAPIIGPTLGGWITDNYSWHWIFLINIPIGIIAIIMSQIFVEDPPYIKNAKSSRIDFVGFGFMAIWLATLQIILDKGHQAEWFSAPWICWFAAISAISFITFIIWELRVKEPIVNLRILKDRNFAIGVILMTVVGAILYATLAMLPLFLQTLMNYDAQTSGLTISPRGIGSFLTIVIVGRIFINRIDNRILVVAGFLMLGISNFMLGNINLNIGIGNVIWPNVLSGVGLGLIFIPLTNLTFSTLKNELISNGTGIFNLMRNIGGSIGISIVASLISRYSQIQQNYMVSHLTPYDPIYQQKLQVAGQYLSLKTGVVTATHQAHALFYGILVKQATLWGFIINFRLFGIICILLIPLIFFFQKIKTSNDQVNIH
ncbi:MAG: EmrB/QacA family drug resistance transporter [Candidatus Melainabacteria bacterium RIFOXYA12_FULL_32_12]|nr:MAG: EmrB/QacA family drug resistance transporter [Candidatus Melainabacteria bacterium RIFOXYA2_FULL_32_9]OGI28123.1 MAG: EmrB/QacA family drug resistance transporter [Candidatus Melainabacteria bacterium RIFOXYA12_FULL_32_12]